MLMPIRNLPDWCRAPKCFESVLPHQNHGGDTRKRHRTVVAKRFYRSTRRHPSAFGGRALALETINGIPRFLLPDKFTLIRNLHAGQSGIALAYGLPDEDRADSILTNGFVDFHWLGILYAPIAFAVGAFCVAVIRLCQSRFVAVYVMCYALLQAITPEQYFITESLNMIRLLVVLTPLFFIYLLVLQVGRAPAITPSIGIVPRRFR